jgi:hypothetical protein
MVGMAIDIFEGQLRFADPAVAVDGLDDRGGLFVYQRFAQFFK